VPKVKRKRFSSDSFSWPPESAYTVLVRVDCNYTNFVSRMHFHLWITISFSISDALRSRHCPAATVFVVTPAYERRDSNARRIRPRALLQRLPRGDCFSLHTRNRLVVFWGYGVLNCFSNSNKFVRSSSSTGRRTVRADCSWFPGPRARVASPPFHECHTPRQDLPSWARDRARVCRTARHGESSKGSLPPAEGFPSRYTVMF